MSYLEDACKFTIIHEGFKPNPYDDATGKRIKAQGFVTVGYGHNLDAKPLTEHFCKLLLQADLMEFYAMLQTCDWWRFVKNDAREIALLDMCFNLGFSGLCAFKKMIAAIRAGDWEKAADEALNSKWATQVGRRARNVARVLRAGRIVWPELEK